MDVLSALTPTAPKEAVDSQRLAARVEIAETIALLAESGQLTSDSITALKNRFSPKLVGRFRNALPKDSALLPVFIKHVKEINQRYRKHYLDQHPRPPAKCQPPRHAITSPEFLDAIEKWSQYYHARADRKAKFGNTFSPRYVARKIGESRRFCAYLESDGITRWCDVAQRHLDGYLDTTTRGAALIAYPFLLFVKKHFRIPATFKRPRNANPAHVRPRLLTMLRLNQILEAAQLCSNTEVNLALHLVAIYGQTVQAVCDLTMDRIRETPSGYEVQFSEVWVPIDQETSEVLASQLHARAVSLAERNNTSIDNHLVLGNCKHLADRAFEIAKVSMKDVRINAIVNIMESGLRDRHAIELSLGISGATIASLERAFGWDHLSAVSDEAAKMRHDLLDGKLSDR